MHNTTLIGLDKSKDVPVSRPVHAAVVKRVVKCQEELVKKRMHVTVVTSVQMCRKVPLSRRAFVATAKLRVLAATRETK